MPSPESVRSEIGRIIRQLVNVGLADRQHGVFRRSLGQGLEEVTFDGARQVSIAFRDRDYRDIYADLLAAQAFVVMMPDGALLQMWYLFSGEELQQHRLAMFPSPDLEEFQNSPELYLEDAVYSEVVARSIVPFPFRFDYDRDAVQDGTHPKSHLTLGQYARCRIPVTAPVTPCWFIDFVLRNFYNAAFRQYADQLHSCSDSFVRSITSAESRLVHVAVPDTMNV